MTTCLPRAGVPLAGLTTLGVGGRARWFVTATSVAEIQAADDWSREQGTPLWVLGGGSNVVVADDGFDGLVLQVAVRSWRAAERDSALHVEMGAGESWDAAVARLVEEGWAGVECLSGIPGTVGGTPVQNVGAYGQDVASRITSVQAYDRLDRTVVDLSADDCGFSYRQSRFKGADQGRFVVATVGWRLSRGEPTLTYPDIPRWLTDHGLPQPTLADVRTAVLAIRRGKGMVADGVDADSRSVGSFFMNPVVSTSTLARLEADAGAPVPARSAGDGAWRVPAAWLIERAGWRRGDSDGPVGLSSKHPLAVINRGAARAVDVVRFAARVKRRVVDTCGVYLVPEPTFVGFGPEPELDELRKAQG